VAVPVRCPPPGRCDARRGQRLAGEHPDPLAAIHVGVNRWAHGEEGRAGSEPFLPEQALDPVTAFAAYTSGSARANHRDDGGRLRPGAVADLVVLDRDPFAGPPEEIGATRVVSTWIDGVTVFEA
jgi:predicted amidohydrolase YtcJ